MANPGEEMVCGQCGQNILGKAMKVNGSSSSLVMLMLTSTSSAGIILSVLLYSHPRCLINHGTKSILTLTSINSTVHCILVRQGRNIGTSITSSAATVESGSVETAR